MKHINKFEQFINESNQVATDVTKFFGGIKPDWQQSILPKIIQYIIQDRESEAYLFMAGKIKDTKKFIDTIKQYLNQIPADKMSVLKSKKGEEIQKIFSGNSLDQLVVYLKNQNLI